MYKTKKYMKKIFSLIYLILTILRELKMLPDFILFFSNLNVTV